MHTETVRLAVAAVRAIQATSSVILAGAAVAAAAGDDQGVKRRWDVLEAASGGDREAAGCAREGVAAHECDLVAGRGATALLAGAV